jgi:C-terminal processing protease CtpA/Prc
MAAYFSVPGTDRRRYGEETAGLYAQDPNIKGLVLDLRNDPGGVLPGAIGVSAAFLPKMWPWYRPKVRWMIRM